MKESERRTAVDAPTDAEIRTVHVPGAALYVETRGAERLDEALRG